LINSVARICERTGADVREVSRAIGTDARIGPKFLTASIGFGGSCFQVSRESAVEEMQIHGMEVADRQFCWAKTPEEAVAGAHAIVVLTEWEEFKKYDYEAFYEAMMKPAFLFDGRNLLDVARLEEIGFEAHALGKSRVVERSAAIERAGSFSLNDLVPLS